MLSKETDAMNIDPVIEMAVRHLWSLLAHKRSIYRGETADRVDLMRPLLRATKNDPVTIESPLLRKLRPHP